MSKNQRFSGVFSACRNGTSVKCVKAFQTGQRVLNVPCSNDQFPISLYICLASSEFVNHLILL